MVSAINITLNILYTMQTYKCYKFIFSSSATIYKPVRSKKLVENNYQIEVICLSDSLNHSDNNFDFSVHRIKRRQSLIKRWIKTVLKIKRSICASGNGYVPS